MNSFKQISKKVSFRNVVILGLSFPYYDVIEKEMPRVVEDCNDEFSNDDSGLYPALPRTGHHLRRREDAGCFAVNRNQRSGVSAPGAGTRAALRPPGPDDRKAGAAA